ncbi:MAG: hypothetical protein E6Q34_01745 [Burkholderiaceae bacterium]|nr:MAG: hypothetical protein E6Q34_01745 [Burkholderiaceae bacterium]
MIRFEDFEAFRPEFSNFFSMEKLIDYQHKLMSLYSDVLVSMGEGNLQAAEQAIARMSKATDEFLAISGVPEDVRDRVAFLSDTTLAMLGQFHVVLGEKHPVIEIISATRSHLSSHLKKAA